MKAQNLILGVLVFSLIGLAMVGVYDDFGSSYGIPYANEGLSGNLTNLQAGVTETITESYNKTQNQGLLGGLATIFTTGSLAVFNVIFGFIPALQSFMAFVAATFNLPIWIPVIISLGLFTWVIMLLISAILKWRMQND